MRIGLEDIDPVIAQAIEERLCAPVNEFLREPIHWGGLFPYRFNWQFHKGGPALQRKREPSEDERRAFDLRKSREEQMAWRLALAIGGPLVAGAGAFFGLHGMLGEGAALAAAGTTWATGSGAGAWWTIKALPKERLRHRIQLEEMRAVCLLLTLSRAERIYCDALLMLARTEVDEATEKTMRGTLQQLNDLLANSRQLEARRQSLLPIMGLSSIPELEREFGDLGRRLDQATDGVTRQALQQSLQMCSTRLENARMLEQSLERLNVQQEAVVQTLASALSAMARLQVSGTTHVEMTAQEISQTVSQMNQQTYAVEQAVEEVITLRQG